MQSSNSDNVIFREVQRLRQIWIWGLVFIIAAFAWYGFIVQVIMGTPFGSKPAPDAALLFIWIVFGIIFPFLMLGFLKLVTEVRNDGIYIRFIPFHFHYKAFMFEEIDRCEFIVYNSFKEFGGYGLRINFKGEIAYNISGKHGLKLRVQNKSVVIGTQKPEEFKKAIDSLTVSRPNNRK